MHGSTIPCDATQRVKVRVIRSCGVAAEREAVLVSAGHLRLPRPNTDMLRVAPRDTGTVA